VRFRPLPVRVGMASGTNSLTWKGCIEGLAEDGKDHDGEDHMAKIIEFYIPSNFRKNDKWIPPQERGKIIEFNLPTKKSA
jgi:hypothetical protein